MAKFIQDKVRALVDEVVADAVYRTDLEGLLTTEDGKWKYRFPATRKVWWSSHPPEPDNVIIELPAGRYDDLAVDTNVSLQLRDYLTEDQKMIMAINHPWMAGCFQ